MGRSPLLLGSVAQGGQSVGGACAPGLAQPLTNRAVLSESQLPHLQSIGNDPASQDHCEDWVKTGVGQCFGSSNTRHLQMLGTEEHGLPLTCAVTLPLQVYEVVRPLVRLLDTQRDGIQNYEALLGLTNLSGRSDKLR